jgi:hypothetical protein
MRDRAESVQDDFGHDLRWERSDEGDHLLVHEPVAFLDPRCQVGMSQEFLDRDGQGTMEGREVLKKVAFLAEPEAVNDGNAVRPVEGGERLGNLRVRVHWQIAADIWEDESIVVDCGNFVRGEL